MGIFKFLSRCLRGLSDRSDKPSNKEEVEDLGDDVDNVYVIVGLGNPGAKYDNTRHNVGFSTIDSLAKRFSIKVSKIKFKGLYGEGRVGTKKVVLLKPQTFMNNSGRSVMEAVSWYKIDLSNLIVIYDDVDIDFGKIRLRPSGSSGTHNGMKSIIYLLNSDKFPRVRIGIGRPKPGWKMSNFVLSKFDEKEAKEANRIFELTSDAVEKVLTDGIDSAMNIFNVRGE